MDNSSGSISKCHFFLCLGVWDVLDPERRRGRWPPPSLPPAARGHKSGRRAATLGSELPTEDLHGGAALGRDKLRHKRDGVRRHPQRTQAAPLLHSGPRRRGRTGQPRLLELRISPGGGLPHTNVYLTHVTFRYFINVRGRFLASMIWRHSVSLRFLPRQGCAQNDNCHICFSAERCASSPASSRHTIWRAAYRFCIYSCSPRVRGVNFCL